MTTQTDLIFGSIFTNGTITGATGVLNSKKITIKNATITGTNGNGLTNYGIADVVNGKIESTTSIGIYNSGTLMIPSSLNLSLVLSQS